MGLLRVRCIEVGGLAAKIFSVNVVYLCQLIDFRFLILNFSNVIGNS